MKNKDEFGERIKAYESEYEQRIPYNEYIIVRIDGHKFSRFTKGFKRPFDTILSDTFREITSALIKEFNAVVGYTQSDEITLVIPPNYGRHLNNICEDTTNNQIFGGRTQKMSSLISAFTTMKFNEILATQVKARRDTIKRSLDYIDAERLLDEMQDTLGYWKLIDTKKVGKAWFDCRVFGVPDETEAFNSVLWRMHDCTKNSYSQFAYAYCSHKSLLNKTGQEMVEFCKETTGNDWSETEERFKYGTIVKKQDYTKPKTDEEHSQETIRTKTVFISKKLSYSEENVEFLLCKKLEEVK